MDTSTELMHPLDLLPANPPLLSEQLKQRTDELRSRIVRANRNTQFAQAASELTEFRHAMSDLINDIDDDALSDIFQKTVQFTTYDSYAPFIARFFNKPCRASDIVNTLAPGFPDFLAESSSTSGGLPKFFPKYNRLPKIGSPDPISQLTPEPLRRRTATNIWYLWCDRTDVIDEDNCSVATIYPTFGSAVDRRTVLNLDPEKDEEKMGTFVLDDAAPYATGFIKKWRSFLLIHALFAAGSRSLETMSMSAITTFVDMIRHLDAQFDMIVDCIANGTIPDLDGIAEVKCYLEPNISPDTERAAELRDLGRPSSSSGWCRRVWPNLRLVSGVASGSFASSVPLAKWYLGPNVEIHSFGFGSTEGWIGSPYNPIELNHFKPASKTLIEFLDNCKGDDSISALAQPWQVEAGRRYELVLTTQDGLWRYRLGDVVEIAGFDPTDGAPIIQFIERRNVAIRFTDFMVTEKELRAAIYSAPLENVVDWTTTIDDRCLPTTIGFFIELADERVTDVALNARDYVLNELLRSNANIAWDITHEVFSKPTIRLVRSGTFSEFRQLKVDEGSKSLGQVKIPVVLPKPAYVTWLSSRVVQEL